MADEPSYMIITCQCGQKMKAPPDAAGKTYKCVRCGGRIKAGETSAQSASPSPAPQDPPKAREVIGQMLVDAGLIKANQLSEALECQEKQGGKTFEILIRLGYLKKDDLHNFLSRQAGVAAIDLKRLQIDRKLIDRIPRELALECSLLPIDQLGKLLTVAMACPLDSDTIEKMEKLTGLKVKAVLCKLDDILAAVKKYYPDPSASVVSIETLNIPKPHATPKIDVSESLNSLEDLPVSSTVREQFQTIINAPKSELRELAAVVSQDPPLAALLIRQANHTAYGMPGQVDNIPMAVALLGRNGMAVTVPPQKAYPTPWLEGLRQRSVRCARIAEGLAQAIGQINPGTAFSAGLFSAIGTYALAVIAPQVYSQLNDNVHGAALSEHESKFFNLAHPEVGMILAARWGYPVVLAQTLRLYLTPEKATTEKTLAQFIHIAARLANLAEEPAPPHIEPLRPILSELKIDLATVLTIAQQHPLAP